ncbi:holin [Kitasatospora cineracea]|uniref:5-methylcytosine-specific restriction protein A n=1 Tax=Kitasatospora cineracea TaxID=88074 RepID=A0A3N4RJT7_9ACTN|nr:holin [Kitasatospora cineracea]RPE27300.1 5-methylcytosine-specific restriction protein A [Kitasatospora cineracea]
MPRRALTVCNIPGCPEFTDKGRCEDHRREAEQRRGTARQRGYGTTHTRRFRAAVLARDPQCTLCGQAPSVHADHHPLSRRELAAQGLDPDDPAHGRGLCHSCHSRETAQHQPGGWHA